MSAFQRQAGIMKELSQMVRDHIFRTVLRKAPKERIEEMLRSVKCHKSVEIFRDGVDFTFYDLLDLVDAAGIDIGLTIRIRDGEEVTFYPGHNFGETGGKNGTPREKRAAKKPFETHVYDYRDNNRYQQRQAAAAARASAANPTGSQLPLAQRLSHGTGVYSQLDDDHAEPIGPKIPPTDDDIPCG